LASRLAEYCEDIAADMDDKEEVSRYMNKAAEAREYIKTCNITPFIEKTNL
jgi:hypothetical protein